MHKQWTTLKNAIRKTGYRKGMFLSLIDAEGNIVTANASMLKSLHLESPRKEKINILQLLHPGHIDPFLQAMHEAQSKGANSTAELYLKNGYYHPVKWNISFLGKQFLCSGYKLVDDERLKRFTDLGETNYQLIVESLAAGIFVQDHKGELIAANQKAADMFSTTLERLYQLTDINKLWDTAWEITNEKNQPVLFQDAPFMKAMRTGKLQSEVLIITLHTGEKRYILFNSQPLFDTGITAPYSVVSNIVDVTRERELFHEARESDNLFRSFMSRTPNLAWVLDENRTLLMASQAWYEYFGLNEEDAIMHPVRDLIPEAVADALHDKHQHVLDTGESIETEEKVKWVDGSYFAFHVNIFPIEGAGGKRLVGGHAVNLSDKYKIQKQLRETTDRLMLLTRTTTDAIWEWDMQTGKIFRNDSLMDMIGYQFDDPKGLSWWLRRIHPEDRDRVSEAVKHSTEKNMQSWEEEYRFKCSDGTYKHMRDKGFIVYENQLPVKMIGSLQDVTDLKNLENELLEQKLVRQKELSETAIRVQEKERTRIGHELHDNVNQILSTTKMFVDMLAPVSEGDKQLKTRSIDYLVMAIEEIRKLSKELVTPQLKDRKLVDSIQQLIDDLRLTTNIRIQFIHDHEIELLGTGKKVTFFRIVQEQVKNILKYSKADKVDIQLICREGQAVLTIRDNGIGFDPKQPVKGIGLSNIQERARFYNGEMKIDSSKGNGCVMQVSLPIDEIQ
jgi:PAS domain S-box-containing protein